MSVDMEVLPSNVDPIHMFYLKYLQGGSSKSSPASSPSSSPRMRRMRNAIHKTLNVNRFLLDAVTDSAAAVDTDHQPQKQRETQDSEGLTGPYIARWTSTVCFLDTS